MAVLQKIRNKGVLLVTAIAVALALFVLGDLLRGGEGMLAQQRQTVGEVNGESVSIQDFQKYLTQFQFYYELAGQRGAGADEQVNDAAWNSFVQSRIVAQECEKLGLSVADAEVAEAMRAGQSQFLQVPAFMNQQTGQFDYASVSAFLTQYQQAKAGGEQMQEEAAKLYDYYLFAQDDARNQLLARKYQVLMSKCFLSNPVEAEKSFADRSDVSSILLAALPYSSVAESDVKVSDDEVRAKYEQVKERYVMPYETRDVKFIDVPVLASEADKAALEKEMDGYYQELSGAATAADINKVIRESSSLIPYSDVLRTKDAYPAFIAERIDGDSTALAVGGTSKPYYDAQLNAFYSVKLVEKTTQADSVLFRSIAVIGKDEQDAGNKADSIVAALAGGAKFKDMAKKYSQSGDSTWLATADYQRQSSIKADDALYINTLFGMSEGETRKVKFSNGATMVMQVMSKRSPVAKYKVAAVAKELTYSDETRRSAYNKFSTFLAANESMEKLEANAAKNGYAVQLAELRGDIHRVGNVAKSNEAVRWIFDNAKANEVSQLYECGDSQHEHFMVVALTGVNKQGYRPFDKVKEELRMEVVNEKKAEKLLADCKGVGDMAAARKLKGVVVDSVNNVSFANAAYIPALQNVSEPIVSALASKTAKGAFGKAVRGNYGVYMLQVLDKTKTAEKYDAKAEQSMLASQAGNFAMRSIINGLYLKASVKDMRYKFF